MKKFTSFDFKGLPFQAINSALGLTLKSDEVHLTENIHAHIYEGHINDYDLCINSIDIIISTPDYVGQSPKHTDSFELIKCIQGKNILVAISGQANDYGKYLILSSYSIEHNTLQRRIRKKYIKSL